MNTLEDILMNISDAIEKYQNQKLKFIVEQSEILRDLTTNLAQLETYRADYYDKWLDVYFKSKKVASNAAAEKIADREISELHTIRMIMRGASRVADSIRSTISSHKNIN